MAMKIHSSTLNAGAAALVVLAVAAARGEEGAIRAARDATEKRDVPTPKDTIPFERLDTLVSHDGGARFASTRVISPPMPIAVRQNHPDGPTYQEGITYTFLVHSMKRPRLVRMEDGRLVLVATAWIHRNNVETPIILYSDDEGESWSQPQQIPRYGQLAYLGGKRLMLAAGGGATFSNDGGETWGGGGGVFQLPDGRRTWIHGSFLVEDDDVRAISYSEADPHGPTDWGGTSWLWHSPDSGSTWDAPIALPPEWCTSEGSVTRAKDGALVVSLRTAQATGLPSYSDHWRRITTARSVDDGLTWTDHQVHFRYGKVHTELLTLPDGDILMTYAARMGELDDHLYHGIEAVLSHDHGKTWDWANRFILFRWAMHQTTHSPASVQLADGRILTVFLYTYDAPWGKGAIGLNNLGITSAVFWSPYPATGIPSAPKTASRQPCS